MRVQGPPAAAAGGFQQTPDARHIGTAARTSGSAAAEALNPQRLHAGNSSAARRGRVACYLCAILFYLIVSRPP